MHFEIVSLALALPHIKDGQGQAARGVHREDASPIFLTCRRSRRPDIRGASYVSWYGIYVPSATPDAIVEKIHDGINNALQNPDVQRQLSVADIPGKPMPLKDLAGLMKADHDKLTAVVKASGMKVE